MTAESETNPLTLGSLDAYIFCASGLNRSNPNALSLAYGPRITRRPQDDGEEKGRLVVEESLLINHSLNRPFTVSHYHPTSGS